jgi:hypothetical protein
MLNEVQIYHIDITEPVPSQGIHDGLAVISKDVCVLVYEDPSYKDYHILSVGPLFLPIIPIGLPGNENGQKSKDFVLKVLFYTPGQDDRKLAYDPRLTSIEYEDGDTLTPRVVKVIRGVISYTRERGRGLLERKEHVTHHNYSTSLPIHELQAPVRLQDWNSFQLVFPAKIGSVNAFNLKVGGLTQDGNNISIPTFHLNKMKAIRYSDGVRTNLDGTPDTGLRTSREIVLCNELLSVDSKYFKAIN